jgi:uncharacterized membrane protein YbaN (DUF454 family)
MKRWWKLAVGWAFVALGVLGLVLPILQGVLFLAIGLTILSRESPWAKKQLDRLRRRHPEWSATFDRAADRATAWLKRFNNRQRG